MTRRLDAEEEALWARVIATVEPLHPARADAALEAAPPPAPPRRGPDRAGVGPRRTTPAPAAPAPPPRAPTESLDAGWDRRLASGRVEPDIVIDLHGHRRDTARHLLYRKVLEAEARGARVILVITGKGHDPGPAPADLMPGLAAGTPPRGAIKADLPRWLGEEGLSHRIAAVRRAHPRHGGAGAAYLILKRKRG
jgi:DNA-nicking Smr family endonuclease